MTFYWLIQTCYKGILCWGMKTILIFLHYWAIQNIKHRVQDTWGYFFTHHSVHTKSKLIPVISSQLDPLYNSLEAKVYTSTLS